MAGEREIEIVELTFHDPKGTSARVETSVSLRLTRATNDEALVGSWLGTFDPVDSVTTLVLYRRVSCTFLTWLTRHGLTVATLTLDDLVKWRDQLTGKASTRSNRLAIVKSLLGYGHRTGYLRFDVGRGVRGPKVDVDADFRSLAEVDIAMMFQTATVLLRAERARERPRQRFLRAALSRLYLTKFLYYSACRIAEATAVTWRDVQARPDGDYQLSVLGKGRKRRKFPMPGIFVEQLKAEYMAKNATLETPIFDFGVRRAQKIIEDLAGRAGVMNGVSPHAFRHAAATHALDRGAPIHVVSQTLGHASLATTSRYVHKRGDGAAKYLPNL